MRGRTHLGRRLFGATLITLCCAAMAIAAPPSGTPPSDHTKNIDVATYFDANALLMFIDNTGSVAYDKSQLLGRSNGFYFPRLTNRTAMYSAGLWVGAKVNGQVRVTVAEYSDEFVPGPMAGGTYQADSPSFRVYKIREGDTPSNNPDYADWPIADGAPVTTDDYGNTIPLLLGKQALWTVFNDADASAHDNDAGNTAPLGLEVQLYAFGDDQTCERNQAVFLCYTIINKSANTLNDAFISFWVDPDLGNPGDDLVGCDTVLDLGYCYNDGPDDTYGPHPPAVGVKLLQGPIVPSPGDSAWVLSEGGWVHGVRGLPMSAFTKYINGTDPHSSTQSYNYMRGLDASGGTQINPSTGMPTTFMLSGDPVVGTGWIDGNSDDRRMMLSCGPLTMAPGDSQFVAVAVMIGAAEAAQVYDLDDIIASHSSGSSDGEVTAQIANPAVTTGHDYRVTFQLADTEDHYTWALTDRNTALDVLTGQLNQSGDDNYSIVDGLKVKVIGKTPGVGGWEVPNGYRRISWAGADFGLEGFSGAIGWASPHHLLWGGAPGVPMTALKPVLLKFAETDDDGVFAPDDPNASYGYRYGRLFANPPAKPGFAPYITNPTSFYSFQDFTINVPLSAWDTSVDPPRRLAVGFLENNAANGDVNGRYWPPDGSVQDNVLADGPREWLFIFDADYGTVPNPAFEADIIENPMPIMYWLTVSRRPGELFQAGDEFTIIPSEGYNTDADVFDFSAPPAGPIEPDVVVCAPGIGISVINEVKRVAAHIQEEFYNFAVPPMSVSIDILPGECPNYLRPQLTENRRRFTGSLSAGASGPSLVRVAVRGTPMLDVTTLDPMSFSFEGVAPKRYAFSDVVAPFVQETACDCGNTMADGITDLVLSYDREAVLTALGDGSDSEQREVMIGGQLKNGRNVTGSDCVIVEKSLGSTMAAGAQLLPTRLDGNYPNPFNAQTVVSFQIKEAGHVRLEVFDVLGRRVRVLVDGPVASGTHRIEWDGADSDGGTLASGMYFYRLTAGNYVATKKMVMLK